MVRTGEARARVAGIFEVRDSAAVRRCWSPPASEIEDGELLIEREILAERQVARLRRQPPRRGCALERSGAVPGRHPRTARSAASVLDRRAARHAGRVRRSIASCWSRVAAIYRTVARRRRRAGGTGAHRAGEAAPAGPVGLPAQGDRKRGALAPDEDAALENERRVLQNVQRLQEAPARPTPRCTTARNRRCP